jgi:hypothetical protein
MRLLRQRIGERLIGSGAEMAFDSQHIARGVRTARPHPYDDAMVSQVLFLVDLVGRIKVRLGLLIMP